jgi:hypothetical protein
LRKDTDGGFKTGNVNDNPEDEAQIGEQDWNKITVNIRGH